MDVERKPELHKFMVFDMGRIREATSNPVKAISFCVGPLFLLGALLFVIGTIFEMDPHYWDPGYTPAGNLMHVDIPFFVRPSPYQHVPRVLCPGIQPHRIFRSMHASALARLPLREAHACSTCMSSSPAYAAQMPRL